MNIIIVSPKYQVVIPLRIRKAFRVVPGEKMQVVSYENRIELVPVKKMRKLKGFLSGLKTRLRNGGIDQFADDVFVEAIVLGGLADHLQFRIQFSYIEPRLMFSLRFKDRLMDQIAVLANEDVLEIFLFHAQTGPPEKSKSVRSPIIRPDVELNDK